MKIRVEVEKDKWVEGEMEEVLEVVKELNELRKVVGLRMCFGSKRYMCEVIDKLWTEVIDYVSSNGCDEGFEKFCGRLVEGKMEEVKRELWLMLVAE